MNSSSSCASGRDRALQPQQVVDPQVAARTRSAAAGRRRSVAVERRLTSASASRVLRARHRAHLPALEAVAAPRGACARAAASMSGCLTLYSPLTCFATSSESLTTSTSVAPSARARSSPSSRPRYSATLFVASPIRSPASVEHFAVGRGHDGGRGGRPGVAARAAVHVDDEPSRDWSLRGSRRQRREVAGHARTPPVAHLAHATAAAGVAPLLLAAVDDDRRRSGRPRSSSSSLS